MKRMYVAAGIALLATTSCNPLAARSNVTAQQAAPAPPSATVYVTPTPEATVPAFVQVPDLAHRPLDVAEYLLDSQGLGHAVVGPDQADYDANQLRVCSTLPRAGTTVRSGTRVALVVRFPDCADMHNGF